MPADEKQNRSESDLACTRCRERKIRCGRERPQCSNCDRDDNPDCVYQTPVKRVNHLKLLCDGVDRLQDRFTSLESHLARLTLHKAKTTNGDNRTSVDLCSQASTGRVSLGDDGDGDHDDDNYDGSDFSPLQNDYSTDLHVFRNEVDMVDRYHGPSSLYVLCNQFRLRALAAGITAGPGADMLHNLCGIAGGTESFPSDGNHPYVHPLPKQQAVTAVGHFFQHLDYATDVFVQRNLLANLERVYSEPLKPRDEVWAICFKAIVLLVLGKEFSAQGHNAFFGDFARSFLPSRAALINLRLLTAPTLPNVQTLILLSVAAQHFDPHGWAELLFTHACMLARTMGLHHLHHLHGEAVTDETLERAKVLRSLYSRDKSLCTTRGCVSWLPSDGCNIASQLGAAVGPQAPFPERFRLAAIQEDIHRLTNADLRRRPSPSSQVRAAVQRIEQQLDQYACTFRIFGAEISYSPCRALIPLEFLATRILALQHGSGPRHAEQVRSDACASCLLLLMAHGDQDQKVTDAFNSLTCHMSPTSLPLRDSLATDTSTIPFTSVLDAFSVPAFFVLLDALLQPMDVAGPIVDAELVRKVSACYTESTGRLQSNSYHRKVAWIFERLLTMIDASRQAQQHLPQSPTPPMSMAEMLLFDPPIPDPSLQPQPLDFSNPSTGKELPSFSSQSTSPGGISLPWDNWLSGTSSLGPTRPSTGANSADGFGAAMPDLLAHMLCPPSQRVPSNSGPTKEWPTGASEPPIAPKRRRTYDSDPDPPR
ncbi:MAG: hypothetical protein L6R35_000702 [Caloplaca aegaea]|nr:MAG: hypothetical protein L6R35_000702 [Caloplaca aegaea]